ncbi:MAG: NUDIX domain-containing protein [Patescibacteria group bacterium]|nr:NUDIX domain-containing protein [Patescibacteria group bacterium]MDE2015227.1 NUDIX domain-containing protein [Patescibacteria group bacterium]MDE2227033.1 NUDIX domain-containing protein [Patescibacteria group bacterium]
MVSPKPIPEALYRKIVGVMPIPCVDAVIVRGKKFLLGKRINKPAKGQWFVIGGRVLKGESLEAAVRRHVQTETGISGVKVKKFLIAAPTMFKNSAQGPSSHTINSVFLVELSEKKLLLNNENEKLKWFSRIDKNWHPYVKNVLQLAGFK